MKFRGGAKLNWLAMMLAVIVGIGAGVAFGQSTNSGDIQGTVADSSGAVLPDVSITVVNINTGVSKTYVTNHDGLYDTSSIVAGTYKITFSKDGFSQLVRSSVTVTVGNTTINATLQVGSLTEQVLVNTDIPLLTTESAEQSTTLQSESMAQLPTVGQDWESFAILLPGAQNAPGQSLGFFGGTASGQVVSANGNLPYSSVLADGAETTLPSSANSDISVFETVQEVKIATSAFSAQYGVGGIIYNQISKGGTDRFHGALYDYFQNSALNAATYAPNGGTRTQNLSALRYNNFGGSIGGPILKRKMFFYFNFDKIVQNGGQNSGVKTVPTAAMLAGDFTGQPTIYDPATTKVVNGVVTRTSFADEYGNGNKIPASRLDAVAKAMQAYYPSACAGCGTLNGSGQVINNYSYNSPNPNPFTKYFGRLDYDITSNNRLTMSNSERDNPAKTTGDGTCPVYNCFTGDVSSINAQITDVWTISSHFINEARLGYTNQLNFFAPLSLGQGYPSKMGWQFAKADNFPDIQINGAINNFEELQPGTNATYKEHAYDPSDVITLIRGKHILHFGGEYLFYRDNSTAWNNINGGQMAYTGVYTQCPACAAANAPQGLGGVAYADFLLGQTQSWNAQVTPEYGGRQRLPQMFIQDDYKLTPNLTVNLGLRYQIQSGWGEVKGNMATFDPAVQNPVSGSLGALWYGTTRANGRTTLQSPGYTTFLPRVGFAYQPHSDMTIRGGFGIYAYNWSLDTYGNGMGGAFGSRGNVSDGSGYQPVVTLSSNGASLPYTPTSTNPAALNGTNVTYNQYKTPVPQIYQWNLSVQHALGSNMVVELAYVASHGYNLNFPVDVNQVPLNRLGPNDQQFKPYPQFGQISGSTNNAISNYNSLQASVQKRLSQGLSFDFNYVWSHFLDDIDSSGWGSRAGKQPFQNSYNPSANYGNSNFDVRNSFKGSIIYQLPLGRGRQFLNNNFLLDEVLGGWQTSSTIIVQSGNPFTALISGGNDTSNSQSIGSGGYSQYPNVVGSPNVTSRSIKNWFNSCTILTGGALSTPGCTPAWAVPAVGTFGNSHRNSLVNPALSNVNFSLSKTFNIWEDVKFQLKADTTNLFNHPILGFNNNVNVDAGASNITNVINPGRTMQIGARLAF